MNLTLENLLSGNQKTEITNHIIQKIANEHNIDLQNPQIHSLPVEFSYSIIFAGASFKSSNDGMLTFKVPFTFSYFKSVENGSLKVRYRGTFLLSYPNIEITNIRDEIDRGIF